MTQEAFIEELKGRRIPYEVQGERIIVTRWGPVGLSSLETIPSGVEFRNEGNVWLDSLKVIPPDAEFKNEGNVYLNSLKAISPDVVFRNMGDVYFPSLLGGWVHEWQGNIKGVHYKTLLNHLIKKGAFV